ncbi:MAG: trypsin-like serine protease, partial [Candidatus Nanohaloarchaea archaeon]
VYDTIDREEWERRETALDALRKTGKELLGKYSEDNVGLAFTYNEESPTDFGVEAIVAENSEVSRQEVEDALPTVLTGEISGGHYSAQRDYIPLDVVEEELENACGGELDSAINPPAGAIPIEAGGSEGTTNAAFYSDQYGEGLVTAGHIVGANNIVVEQDAESNEFLGLSEDYHKNGDIDCAFIQMTSEPIGTIVSPDYSDTTDLEVAGIITDEELKNNVGNAYFRLDRQGRSSCRDDGYIVRVGETFWGDVKSVETSQNVKEGDSGGPLFFRDGEVAEIAGGIVGSGGEGTVSTTAETIEEELNGNFF